MALHKLKQSSFILLEDDYHHNVLPLLMEIVKEDKNLHMFSYEQPASIWLNVFKNKNVQLYDKSSIQNDVLSIKDKGTVIIDSVNEMSLGMGWNKCLLHLRKLYTNPAISKLIVILHRDCVTSTSKITTNLKHLAGSIVTYDSSDSSKINIIIKKGGKIFKSEELLSYDHKCSVLNSQLIEKPDVKEDVVERVSPGDLATFKIEVDQVNQLAKNQLKLPYMSKINESKGRVYYEPDAVDDWDDEDPDDDLDI